MQRLAVTLLAILASPAAADSMVATHTIKAQSVLTADDFTMVAADIPGALTDPSGAIGQEARVTLYAGKPITAEDLGAAALIARNQTVSLVYRSGGLSILTAGRALAPGAAGDVIKVMNLASHATVTGTVGTDGNVFVTTSDKG